MIEEAIERMGKESGKWTERKPGFYRSPDGTTEIELSEGHPYLNEGPHMKVMKFDPKKGSKGGIRVVEKIFTECPN